MKISVIGTGYVGLVTGTCLSEVGNDVMCFDTDADKVSRLQNGEADAQYFGEEEWLLQYCRTVEARSHHDYYVFGHRHLPLDVAVGPASRYINLGEWVNYCSYGVYDGTELVLRHFEK